MSIDEFARGIIAAAPSPATSGLSLRLVIGHGARFTASLPFEAVVRPQLAEPNPQNAEVVSVTNIAGDILTIVRAQDGSSARTIVTGDEIEMRVSGSGDGDSDIEDDAFFFGGL